MPINSLPTDFLPSKLLERIVRECGTPAYVYDLRIIERQFQRLKNALKEISHTICFAVKANSNLAVLHFIARLGAGFDIVSGGELHRVLKSGGAPSKIIFAGVGKTTEEIRFALASNIRFLNVESTPELEEIESIARSMQTTARIGLRVNPDISVATHPYLATGLRTSKFGITLEEVPALWEQIQRSQYLSLVALDCHIGSGIHEVTPFEEAYTAVTSLADSLRAQGAPITELDFGGGMGISYSGQSPELSLDAFGEMVHRVVAQSPYHILFEPGKFLVAEAGVLLTKVLYTKQNGSKHFAIVTAGMNDLIRPSLYDAYHHIEVLGDVTGREAQLVDVVGPVCETGCFLALDRTLPKLFAGDVLVIRDAGAYGFTMASRYNSRPLPPEVIITDNETYQVVRRRETFEDLVRHEAL